MENAKGRASECKDYRTEPFSRQGAATEARRAST